MKKRLTGLAFWLAFWGIQPSFAQEGITLDKIVAKVDNFIVLKSDVEKLYYNLLYQGQLEGVEPATARCQLLEQLIIEKMMLAKAEIDSIVVEDRQVESQLERRFQAMEMQLGSLNKIEQLYGKTIGDLREELRGEIRNQLVVQKVQSQITESVPKPTPKEVKKFFETIPRDSLPYFGVEVEVAHIVKIPGVNRAQKQAVKEKLEALKQRILQGEDFAELAKRFSEDRGSAKEGGDLNWLTRGTSVPEFEAAIFRMKPGELSRIVESEYGFHLIKLIDKRGNEYRAAHILLRPNYDEVDISESRQFLDSLRAQILLDSLSFEKAAREYSEDKNTAMAGGVIQGPDGDSRVFVEDMDPYLYFTIDTMQVGQISRPLPYRTDDGKSAVRLIYLKSKRPPHEASLETDYQRISNFTYNQKRNQAINEWFVRTKDEVYISIDEEYDLCNILKIQ
ncbi:MAG: peptidylprolyl isomerase [Microscillaceae bacterium]